jgi:hypothetical protein
MTDKLIGDLIFALVTSVAMGLFSYMFIDSIRMSRVLKAAKVPPAPPALPYTWPTFSIQGAAAIAVAAAFTIFAILAPLKRETALVLMAIILWGLIIGLAFRVDLGTFSRANKAWERQVADALRKDKEGK